MKSQATAGIFLVTAAMSLIGDACGIFHNQCGGMLARRMYGTTRPDILEVFSDKEFREIYNLTRKASCS